MLETPAVVPLVPRWLGLALAAGSGFVLDAAFPDRGWWPLILPGIAMVLIALRGASWRWAALVGFIAGWSFYLVHVGWMTLFLGPVPYLALTILEALFFAAGSVLIALAYRFVAPAWPGALARMLWVPLVVAGLWTAREGIAATWPYGGFSWGRVAFSQSASPVSDAFAWLGASGVSFLLLLTVAMAIEAVLLAGRPVLARVTAVTAVGSLLVLLPAWSAPDNGELTVAAVQGNAKAGYFDVREPGDNLADQIEATRPLYGDDVDVVVWPEGGSDLDPLRSAYAERAFDTVATRMDAPLIAGAITQVGERYFNTSLLWVPGERAVDGYDKKHPVPFGEYVPDRQFWAMFAPDLIGMIGREYTPGTRDSVFELPAGARVGVNICFDIVDDALMRASVRDGAQIIFAQTNNADFGRTDESVQQLAIARIRAIETGRALVNISTVGTSAAILPDGTIVDQLPTYEAGRIVETLPLRDTVTPAVAVGGALELVLGGLGLLGLAAGVSASRGGRVRG
ncbi:apolipoprotein N-acyltransferase [Diaminobutyricimonas aerilata]|uniref:Apolipoprotein N-acyltransferase n=1 Tax=Diaminobutyricimonas aerilata TaxID=1162967 RepID=A0A2M9CJU1_9MICO|nr:apolipoprotein N-acyltransferase [Diaminobutyricimonas aerilata]PJJ72156.1 apolipoprotein N-acyltransferase [Diaminobutyricimonas aerilata]